MGTIGFGPPGEDFSVLRSLAAECTRYNSTGIFQKPELTAHSLRLALSTLSTTLTATKTEMTDLGGSSQRIVRDVRREPHSAVNDTHWNSSWWRPLHSGFFYCVAWSSVLKDWEPRERLVTRGATTISLRTNIFGEGAERMVRKFREVDAQGMFVGTPMVAKESRFQDDMALEDRRQFHRVFCETQHQAHAGHRAGVQQATGCNPWR